MLSTSGFNNKFEICKTAVLDLKRELKQYLDQEAQDKMEKAAISEQTSDVVNFSEELETLERQQFARLEIMANYAQIYAAFCK